LYRDCARAIDLQASAKAFACLRSLREYNILTYKKKMLGIAILLKFFYYGNGRLGRRNHDSFIHLKKTVMVLAYGSYSIIFNWRILCHRVDLGTQGSNLGSHVFLFYGDSSDNLRFSDIPSETI
jgi:hypothetical protein